MSACHDYQALTLRCCCCVCDLSVAHQSLSLQELEDLTESLLSLYYESIQLQKYREINEQGFMKVCP